MTVRLWSPGDSEAKDVRDSLHTSHDLDRGSFTEFLLTGNNDLLVAVQARANLDFIADGRPHLDASCVNATSLGVIYVHVGRALRIANNRLARNRQHPFFRRA